MEYIIAIIIIIPALIYLAKELCDELDSSEFREDLFVILPKAKR